ncbi:MAG: TonB family protein, partial [Polyangiaceae bacterium]
MRPGRFVAIGGIGAALIALATPARAQETPSGNGIPSGASGAAILPPPKDDGSTPPQPTQNVIVPPKVIQDEGAQYPAAALAEKFKASVDVSVVITVDASGKVSDAKVEQPAGHGFDEEALAAARKLTFEPATRNGRPIASKTRHGYHFDPPASQLVGRVLSALSDSPLVSADVTVKAADGTETKTKTDSKGAWAIPNLKFGTYRIVVTADRYAGQTVDQSVEPGEEVGNTLRLQPVGKRVVLGAPTQQDDGIDEVTVKGEKPPREVVKRTLERREMERIPGTNGDAIKSIQNLPGVARAPF